MEKIIFVLLFSFIAQYSMSQTMAQTAASSSTSAAKVPVFLDIGFGLGEYEIYDVYNSDATHTDTNAKIYGTQLNISAMVEKETIRRFQDLIPESARGAALKLEKFSVSSMYVPDTLFISPRKDHIQAYGATWGFIAEIAAGLSFMELGVSGGPILTYLNYNDDRETGTIHFIRPGLRGTVFAKVPLFTKYVQLEVGGVGDIYVPQKFHGDKSVWSVKAHYAMMHFLIPFELENPFKDAK